MRKIKIRFLLAVVFLLGSGVLLRHYLHNHSDVTSDTTLPAFYKLPDETARRQFLTEHNLTPAKSAPVRSCPVTIPAEEENSPVYRMYSTLQTEQLLPLNHFCGCKGMEYTYTLQDTACVSLLLAEDGLLLAAVRYDATEPQTLFPVIESL